jgi:ABC-type transporter Mla subunit MlaD
MKHDTIFVDETTKKTMEFINDGIIDNVREVLQSTNALQTIENLAIEISSKFDKLQKTFDHVLEEMKGLEQLPENIQSLINDAQKNQQELIKAVTEAKLAQLQEIESLKNAIVDVLSNMDKTATKNNDAVTGQLKSLEKKIADISIIIETQNRNSRRLEDIVEKLDYLSQPLFKRIMNKPRKENDSSPDANKEEN